MIYLDDIMTMQIMNFVLENSPDLQDWKEQYDAAKHAPSIADNPHPSKKFKASGEAVTFPSFHVWVREKVMKVHRSGINQFHILPTVLGCHKDAFAYKGITRVKAYQFISSSRNDDCPFYSPEALQQVFLIWDPMDPTWSIVLNNPPRISFLKEEIVECPPIRCLVKLLPSKDFDDDYKGTIQRNKEEQEQGGEEEEEEEEQRERRDMLERTWNQSLILIGILTLNSLLARWDLCQDSP
ncbi:unnamed protein product [Calypogeia fissa]